MKLQQLIKDLQYLAETCDNPDEREVLFCTSGRDTLNVLSIYEAGPGGIIWVDLEEPDGSPEQ